MRLQKFFAPLLILCMVLSAEAVSAQRNKKKAKEKEKEESYDFKSHLWYGGNLALGFSGGGGYSIFQFGLAPMVGYKIVEPLSIGPRISVTYLSFKQSNFKAANIFNVDAGVFMRFRAFQGLFIQAEGSNEWYEDVFLGISETIKRTRFNKRLGVGYNFNAGQGDFGSEIGILYNFTIADDVEGYENPIEYRFGFTWNF